MWARKSKNRINKELTAPNNSRSKLCTIVRLVILIQAYYPESAREAIKIIKTEVTGENGR